LASAVDKATLELLASTAHTSLSGIARRFRVGGVGNEVEGDGGHVGPDWENSLAQNPTALSYSLVRQCTHTSIYAHVHAVGDVWKPRKHALALKLDHALPRSRTSTSRTLQTHTTTRQLAERLFGFNLHNPDLSEPLALMVQSRT
jgi:hypothetical protein